MAAFPAFYFVTAIYQDLNYFFTFYHFWRFHTTNREIIFKILFIFTSSLPIFSNSQPLLCFLQNKGCSSFSSHACLQSFCKKLLLSASRGLPMFSSQGLLCTRLFRRRQESILLGCLFI